MPIPQATPPDSDELEVSVFGPGFGESVVVHTGHDEWLIVDSCLESPTAQPKPLEYLESIGVDPATAVKVVIASHWHDDHVAGLSALLAKCKSAILSCSTALAQKDFLQLAELYCESPSRIPPGPREIRNSLSIAAERSKALKRNMLCFALENRPIWTSAHGRAQALALSPSDEMVRRALEFMARSYEIAQSGIAILDRMGDTPNDVATAVRVNVGGRSILLGSDLEASASPLIGWSAVLALPGATLTKSAVYKVAHHGAKSGHQEDVWQNMLSPAPLALMSPFRLGAHNLPTYDDRQRILGKTATAFITAHPDKARSRSTKRRRKVDMLLEQATLDRRSAYGPVGQIRWRAPLAHPTNHGRVELFDGALHLADALAL